MLNTRFLMREVYHGGFQVIAFILCVALSVATMSGLNSFKRDVYGSFYREARVLHGGDLIVHSHYPFSDSILKKIEDIASDSSVEKTRTRRLMSMVRSSESEQSLLATLVLVESNYPLYGNIVLDSGRGFDRVLRSGSIVVSKELLSRLQVQIGAKLHIGEGVFEIADTITNDPTQSASFSLLGPRLYISSDDLEQLNLLGSASRVEQEILIKIDDDFSPLELERVTTALNEAALPAQEQVRTARTARSGVKRFFDNMFFFLSFISIFTLLLSGIGMQCSLSAMVQHKRKTIAIIKTTGATNRFIFSHYLVLVLSLAIIGSFLGILAGYVIKLYLPTFLDTILPGNPESSLHLIDVLESLALGLIVTLLFTFFPLSRLSEIRPVALFKYEQRSSGRKLIGRLMFLFGFIFLSLLVIRQLEDIKTGIYVMLVCFSVIVLITLITAVLFKYFKRLNTSNLKLRQALKSLYRPDNTTKPVVVTLACSLTILLTIYLLETNLFTSFITSYPEDAPNLFFLDIQKDQIQTFSETAGRKVQLYPVIRARLVSINAEPINYERERKRKRDSLAREFNLTYRSSLLDDEIISEGGSLFDEQRVNDGVVEVSVLDTIADIGNIERGDLLLFNIQGVMLEANVTSIRSRTKSKLHPFFYFVFSEDVLQSAPQTFFGSMTLEKDTIPSMITRMVTELPNVSAINVSDTAERFGHILRRLAATITFFSIFSIAAGLLIMISGLLATHPARIREASYYKILGADSGFVFWVIIYENVILGLTCALIGMVCANTAAWLLCRYLFEISYTIPFSNLLLIFAATILLVTTIGVAGSFKVVYRRPIDFLRMEESG